MELPTLDHLYDDGVALLELEEHYALEEIAGLIPKWRTVLGDVARLRAGWRPNDAMLANAPSLSDWALVGAFDTKAVQFVGTAIGHPNFPDFRIVRTSIIVALDTRHLRWARTIGRFYRLLKPEKPWTKKTWV